MVSRVRAERARVSTHRSVAHALNGAASDLDDEECGSVVDVLSGVLCDRVSAGVLSRSDARMVWLTRAGGFRPVEVADRFLMSPDTFRRRRHRVVCRLADSLAPGE